jgi:hypothetical protein
MAITAISRKLLTRAYYLLADAEAQKASPASDGWHPDREGVAKPSGVLAPAA